MESLSWQELSSSESALKVKNTFLHVDVNEDELELEDSTWQRQASAPSPLTSHTHFMQDGYLRLPERLDYLPLDKMDQVPQNFGRQTTSSTELEEVDSEFDREISGTSFCRQVTDQHWPSYMSFESPDPVADPVFVELAGPTQSDLVKEIPDNSALHMLPMLASVQPPNMVWNGFSTDVQTIRNVNHAPTQRGTRKRKGKAASLITLAREEQRKKEELLGAHAQQMQPRLDRQQQKQQSPEEQAKPLSEGKKGTHRKAAHAKKEKDVAAAAAPPMNQQADPQSQYCRKCRGVVMQQFKFCRFCGEDLSFLSAGGQTPAGI